MGKYLEDLIDDLVMEYLRDKMPDFKEWAVAKSSEWAASTESKWDDRAADLVKALLSCEHDGEGN